MNDRAPAPGGLALVQELVNTLNVETGVDALATEEGLSAFGLAPGEAAAARELRESLRAACLAHAGHPPHRAVPDLTGLLASAPLVVTVDAASGAASLAPADASSLTARVASAIAEAITAGTWLRLKACEASDCHWAYYDRSPAGRSRWCDMGVCGARAKMRAYRARGRAAGGDRVERRG
ncbi:CGNR zinc finger domain-containing protein [Streptomyces sp. NPDC041068]|uniref:CGNR zinc finger domain-containing protein n=1 Tax=Streptomyces sp. NPDC041068 TaxID=3155130 RepID=UPI0033CB3470